MQRRGVRKKPAVRHGAKLVQQAVAALDEGKPARAASLAREVIHAAPEDALGWEVLSIALYREGEYEESIEAGSKAVSLQPKSADFHTNLGVVFKAARRPSEAESAYRTGISCNPKFAPAHHNLGNLLCDQGRFRDAEQCFRSAVAIKPDYLEAWHGLALTLQKQNLIPGAEEAFKRALELRPGRADIVSDLATCAMARERNQEATTLLLKAIEMDPNLSSAHGNLGALQLRSGRLVEAERSTRRAMELAPLEARWITNLGVIAKDLCRFSEAEDLCRRALALKPDYALAHANLLFCVNYHPEKAAEEILAEYRRFDAAHAKPHLPAKLAFANDPTPGRKLRVGYLSPDFREHAARHFIEPLLAHYDRAKMELYCYAEVANPDRVTREFQGQADHWRSTVGMTDDEVAALIRRDQIDVLMDFGGHTSSSRLLVMARKPAPVQIAYMLGHGYTSGLSAVDAFLADDALVPQGSERLFTERVIRLPRIPLAYVPPNGMAEVGPLPAIGKGHVTFGYFGRPERINDRVVKAWSEILAKVPLSRLMLNSKAFSEAAFADLMAERFQAYGIGRERLEMVYTSPQPKTWAAYGDVDIALDPFPHNAGTTTIEAVWLGVPVVSIADRPSVGRFGASILGCVGLSDWVAPNVEAYVALAAAKARDLGALVKLRANLRAQIEKSPLRDGKGLARDMEQAFRTLWTDWCKSAGANATEERARQDAITRARDLDIKGRLAESEQAWRAYLTANPTDSELLAEHSDVCRRLGRITDAEKTARESLRLVPRSTSGANALGNALAALSRVGEAIDAFTIAIEEKPDHGIALNNRALALMRRGELTAAERDLKKAIAARPDLADIGYNLATVLQDQGRVPEAVDAFRAALAKVPGNAKGHGMMLFCLTYHPGLTSEQIFDEFRRWNDDHASKHARNVGPWPNAGTGARRLRIGYVSPDFCNKSSRHFIEPMLVGHDRSKVEIFCYAEVPAPDGETERLKALTDHWRTTVGLTDDELVKLIRRDAIDVLVDLGGHTARNRLLALARKPAPVQIAHFLGHGYTSGLAVMDAFLADEELAPAGAEQYFSEPLIRLPRIPISYTPPAGMPPVSPLPALKRGHVTFGHFGRVVRINEQVVAVWARILGAVPRSRLVLNTVAFMDEEVCRRYRAMFAAHGITADRLDLVFTTPQPKTWDAYAGIDISLDPFPHNGGTTTIEAAWLGVPSISLRVRPSVGRFGASILAAIGLKDWAADTIDDYVAKAVARAKDIEQLAILRAGLRQKMQASPLCDASGLAQVLEDAYITLWKSYCERESKIASLQASAGEAYTSGNAKRSAELFRAAADLAPRAEILTNLGAALRLAGQRVEAEAAYGDAIARAPDFVTAHLNLANLLEDRARSTEAEASLRRALALTPNDPQVLRNLGRCLLRQLRLDDAQPLLERALELAPGDGDIYDILAQLLRQRGQPIAAAKLYATAKDLLVKNWRALGNMALLEEDLGRFDEAMALLRRALALKPDYALAHANLLFCVNYHPEKAAEEILAEYRRFDAAHAKPHLPAKLAFANDPTPGRKLRVGYLSPDFREHAARHFIEPLLAHYDRAKMELYCYAEVANPDRVTREFQGQADHWRSTVGMTDDEVAALIRRDQIDVLMDFGGHTSSSRLLVMARKPAPVQIAYMLGHGYTSGLSAVDAFLADDALVPQGSERLFTERVIRLPRIPLAYVPPNGMAEVGPLPAIGKGHVTFGYFGRPERINDRVVKAWSEILAKVPLSRLMLNSKAFSEAAFADLMAERFQAYGISRERLEMVYTSPQPKTWAAYGDVDIALDPFPHNAGTTTIEAVWLGVPVVSIADRPSVGRFGASILGCVGLSDWVAPNVEAYVALATAKARDLGALVKLRANLRAQIEKSPLRDGKGLARDMEQAFRTLWTDWCKSAGKSTATEASLPSAIAAYQAGDHESAWRIAEACLASQPDDVEARHLRGISAYKLGRLANAVDDLSQVATAEPARADVRWNLTVMLRSLGRLQEAEAQGREAVLLAPDAPEAHNNLASVLKELGRQGEAEAHYRRAITLKPDYSDAWSNLSWTLALAGHAREAEAAARRAIAINPRDANAMSNIGTALMQQDRLREATECFEQAVALKPDFSIAHSNLLFCLNYRTDLSADEIFAAYKKWDAVHARKLMPAAPVFANTKVSGRRLRLAYVSSDFRYHAVSFFMEPLIAAHDKSQFEITCYSEVSNPDAVTERFKRQADRWRSTVGMSDAAVAELIRADGIDILVDLTGHTAGNRLLTFARKPAPIQITQMVGAGTTTGLSAMDAFLADEALVPTGAERFFSERVLRLPRIPLVYAPPAGMPDVAPLPALKNGYITFGCFSRTARINDAVIGAWSGILNAVPNSRLVLNSKPFREPEGHEAWRARFAAHGIVGDRISLVYTTPQPKTWEAYGSIDIALDPFPHNAGTTTIEALWLGVPVVSLASRPPVGRFGASILGSLRLDDWVAGNVQQYMRRAADAASDLGALAALRASLRARFKASPLGGDPALLARDMESAYRKLWNEYCLRD